MITCYFIRPPILTHSHTGAAGFIGFHTADRLASEEPGSHVIGIDTFNDYYDPALKTARVNELTRKHNGRVSVLPGGAIWMMITISARLLTPLSPSDVCNATLLEEIIATHK